MNSKQPLVARFYKTEAGNEPVKDIFLTLSKDDRRITGKDIEKVKVGGATIGHPTVAHIRDGLYEIRSTIAAGTSEFLTLFRFEGDLMLLLHAFYKTTPRTPEHEIDLANQRWRRTKGR
jgi:phage-related protein